MFSLHVSVLHQTKFMCLAVHQGRLKVLYDFGDKLESVEPKDPSDGSLMISNAESKVVSLPHRSPSL